ncbi:MULTISPECIES: ABC transporter permease [Staphylococcus]|jgi:putative ABC transport system permease protein|uniref:ABC transporter permease n=2 Tax=Staphylococcus TaxID=1279 RepID=A0A2T4SEE3_9STAP|nr:MULTISPECIES: ABC transporter permease [Staphylococcus]VDG68224.1 ABC transporter permease [Lacrimispora indolis]MBO1205989.1 ABC transporter permease [Staphylococcus nepalensis]MBO1214664.1 ABC transporter permease [Staphylococcus nepalensis]MBO1216696.1 ABC transporter permease [Staphylococcus nepalensis]MBO1221822.1 ABC transporter permease [Staphylococcus nepalensis]
MKNLSNIIAISFKSILKNKRRNIFTMIGIIIGIAAVITIMSLGNGFKQTASEQFEDTGAGKDSATVNYMKSDGEGAKENPFSQQDIDIAKQVNGVTDAKIKETEDQGYSAKMTNAQKKGDISILKKKEMTRPEKGDGFNEDDNELNKKVVTVDDKIAKDVFNNEPIGKTLYIDDQGFKVVGIVNDAMNPSAVNMPANTFDRYMGYLTQDYPSLQLSLTDDADKKEVADKVAKALNKKGSGAGEGSYTYTDMEAFMKNINKVFDGITYFVAAVAGISLFIAGIGVMNVMYISVTERTEEIAIRRAFGAKGRDIEIQFLVESVVLCVIGGIIGLIIGILVASLVDAVTPEYIKSAVSLSSVLIAVGVSTLIGIVFGWIPARSASKKELIDIIK